MNCPLCNQKLIEINILKDYICPTRVTFPNGWNTSHYESRMASPDNIISKWYLPPYLIINVDNKSVICLYHPEDNHVASVVPRLREILILPTISPNNPEKLIKRIKGLIIFS